MDWLLLLVSPYHVFIGKCADAKAGTVVLLAAGNHNPLYTDQAYHNEIAEPLKRTATTAIQSATPVPDGLLDCCRRLE